MRRKVVVRLKAMYSFAQIIVNVGFCCLFFPSEVLGLILVATLSIKRNRAITARVQLHGALPRLVRESGGEAEDREPRRKLC